jgi:hypothetical protein
MAVAPMPTTTELASDFHMPSLLAASAHHRNVKPLGGNANVREELKALITTKSNGA